VIPSQNTQEKTLRIIDANLDRTGEGLRFLEEITRFILDDVNLAKSLKSLRHSLITTSPQLKRKLLQARDAETDVGADLKADKQQKQRDLSGKVAANAKRVQQSLRILEELATLPDIELDATKFGQARFEVYSLEREISSMLLRKDKAASIKGLYAVVDSNSLGDRDHIDTARQLLSGGACIIQLRDKMLTTRELLCIAQELKHLCEKHNALFIVNDYLDIALASGADGLHLGQDDFPVAVARKLLPIVTLIGCSASTVKQAKDAEIQGADYIAVGAISSTDTKNDIKVVGIDTLKEIKKATNLPVVAIGGINRDNMSDILSAGADSVAIISAILKTASPKEATRQIIKQIEGRYG
jgi:thiamine-phosphate pyrophosphorylase